MRLKSVLLAAALGLPAGYASAEAVQINHLDCYFNDGAQALVCPDVLPSGRAAAESAAGPAESAAGPAAPAAPGPTDASDGKPKKGTAEWNAYCAAKYNSFDPATGNYTSYSGKTRPCR